MDPSRWRRVQELFHDAARVSAAERRAWLEARCADDPTLTADVLAMLDEDARGHSLLDRDVGEIARQVVDDDAADAILHQRFGPYRITRPLGEGGMGVVYLAERDDLHSVAAIKILRDAWLSPARRERFTSEQRTLAQLNHASIARLLDAGILPDGTPWFVMEYVEGVPLTEHCRTRAGSIRERLGLFRIVCEAVLYIHQNALIHRDLKPSNILVKADGSVKVLDFGIAKQIEALEGTAESTRTVMRLMTPAYASPEQVAGERLGVHTDIYSLGVVLYELLTGRLPFDLKNRTPTEVETIILRTEPSKPSAAASETARAESPGPAFPKESRRVWDDLDVLCLTALHKDPARRYRSVDALMRDIDHFLEGEPLEARPDALGYRLGKFTRRNWKPLGAIGLGLTVIAGVIAYSTSRLVEARNEAVALAERTTRIQSFMTNLFEGGDPAAGPSESLRVVTLLDRGMEEARSLDGEPAVQAELFHTLGTIHHKLGNFDRADSLLGASLALRKSLEGDRTEDVAESLVSLGLLRADQSELDEAERLVREGLALLARDPSSDRGTFAQATTALGGVLEMRGTYDDAIRVLEEAVQLHASAHDSPAEISNAMTQLANCHFYAGHYDVSDSLNGEVLRMDRELYGERHPHVASDLINLGAIQQERGRPADAETYYREALEIYRDWYGEDHFETAAALTMLGRSLIPQGKAAEAGEHLQRALAIRERVYGPDHPTVASTLNEIGRIAQQAGRLDEAEACYRRMAEIYAKAYGGEHYLIGIARANLGGVHAERKDFGGAEALFRSALECYAKTLPPDHVNTAITKVRLGRALLRQQRYREAERESRAGHDLLIQKTDPTSYWVKSARTDLIEEYVALGDSESAARFRTELADSTAS